jgi:hypothetical protein
MKKPLTSQQLFSVSAPGLSVGYSISATSANTLIFRVHECPRPVSKDWWVTK